MIVITTSFPGKLWREISSVFFSDSQNDFHSLYSSPKTCLLGERNLVDQWCVNPTHRGSLELRAEVAFRGHLSHSPRTWALLFPGTKRCLPLGLPYVGVQNLCLWAPYLCELPWVAPELTISNLYIPGPTWWLFLVPCCEPLFLLLLFKAILFPRWLLWLNESAAAFVICCQVFWEAAFLGFHQAFKEPSGLPAGCLLCSFFLLINAFVLSEWPVLKHRNWVIDAFCCVFFWSPPYLPRLDLIGVCSLWFRLIRPLGIPYIKSCSPLRKTTAKDCLASLSVHRVSHLKSGLAQRLRAWALGSAGIASDTEPLTRGWSFLNSSLWTCKIRIIGPTSWKCWESKLK